MVNYDNQDYEKRLTEIVNKGLSEDSCILFVGPELIKFDGKDYNLAYYEQLPESAPNEIDKRNIKYNETEKIWNFTRMKVQREFYTDLSNFLEKERNIHDEVFQRLADIPFHLIVSLIPDDTLKEALNNYDNVSLNFKSFLIDPNETVPEPTKDELLIYNIYGNIKKRKYVSSYQDYLNFILEFAVNGFPVKFVSAIKNANYLIFIGFEFNRWYNILLLYILNILKGNADKFAVKQRSPQELFQNLVDSSLDLIFINEDSRQFIEDLYEKAKVSEPLVLRNIVPKKEGLKGRITSKQTSIEETRDRLSLVDPIERERLNKNIGEAEKELAILIKQLEKLDK